MASSVSAEPLGVRETHVQLSPPGANRTTTADALYEIVYGQRLELPSMSAFATIIASRLHLRLGLYVEDHALGTSATELLFILDKARDLRRRPDVAFVSTERWPAEREFPLSGDWEVVPDLVVEVVSPNDLASDLLAKIHEYFQYGVRLIWIVYPEKRQVYVYTSPTQIRVVSLQDELDGEGVVPGFRLPLNKLFAVEVAVQNPQSTT